METDRHNTELAKQLYSAPNESSGKSSPRLDTQTGERQEAVITALWKRLREYFGQSWVRQYGDADGEAINAWRDAILDLTEAQIARGVKACQSWTHDFPPTLGQFRELCITVRQENNFTERRIALEKQTGKTVESLEQLAREQTNDSPTVRRAKAEMNALIAGRNEFEFEGRTYPRQTREQAMHSLGLNARWTTIPQRHSQEQDLPL